MMSPRSYFGGPSPLQKLDRISAPFPDLNLWIKRDDLSLAGLGGNKLRKLEYLVADALNKGCDTLITAGAPQSNHCRQTAAAATMEGLDCHLVLGGESPALPTGNILLDNLLGAQITFTEKHLRGDTMQNVAAELENQGRKPYIIPIGGSNGIGAQGYVRAAEELVTQFGENHIQKARIILASSSGGTHAGLEYGFRRLKAPITVEGIRIDKDDGRSLSYESDLANICRELDSITGRSLQLQATDFTVNYSCSSRDYGQLGAEEKDAISLLAREEGVLLDPVYTGRAFAGLLTKLKSGQYTKDEHIVFLHTGGTPALFAYADQF